jgi:hypothetical protein
LLALLLLSVIVLSIAFADDGDVASMNPFTGLSAQALDHLRSNQRQGKAIQPAT